MLVQLENDENIYQICVICRKRLEPGDMLDESGLAHEVCSIREMDSVAECIAANNFGPYTPVEPMPIQEWSAEDILRNEA